jgi:hypothetical protein
LLDEFKLISYILNKKMKTEEFNKIVDEVYNHYLETHQYEPFILQEEMDLSKEDFIKKVTNNYGFGQLFGISLNERELSSQERKDLYDKSNYTKDVFPTDENGWNKLFDGYNIPTKVITLFYKGEEIESYE